MLSKAVVGWAWREYTQGEEGEDRGREGRVTQDFYYSRLTCKNDINIVKASSESRTKYLPLLKKIKLPVRM